MLVQHWERLIGAKDSIEIDMWPEFQNLTGDVIARTAFGSNFEEGKQIFQIQAEQAELLIKAARSVYIPGSRCIYINIDIFSHFRILIILVKQTL